MENGYEPGLSAFDEPPEGFSEEAALDGGFARRGYGAERRDARSQLRSETSRILESDLPVDLSIPPHVLELLHGVRAYLATDEDWNQKGEKNDERNQNG